MSRKKSKCQEGNQLRVGKDDLYRDMEVGGMMNLDHELPSSLLFLNVMVTCVARRLRVKCGNLPLCH